MKLPKLKHRNPAAIPARMRFAAQMTNRNEKRSKEPERFNLDIEGELDCTKMIPCGNCGKENICSDYCNWDCHVEYCKKNGGVLNTPNGLPVRCINHDGTMLECEHGDHPDYKLPVTITFIGEKPEGYDDSNSENYDPYAYENQLHALIYCDRYVAVTLYECQYFMFSLGNAGYLKGNMNGYKYKEWRIADDSMIEIDRRFTRAHHNLTTVGGTSF